MKTDTYLDIEFQDGGLYKAVCKAKAPKGAGNGDFLREVKSLFIEWYGKITFQLPEYNSCERYLWIEGNRHIDLRCEVDGVTIVYTDLTSEQPALDITGTQLEIKDVNNK